MKSVWSVCNNCLAAWKAFATGVLTITITIATRIRVIVVYLNYVSWYIDKLIHQPLTVHLCEYAALVVVSVRKREQVRKLEIESFKV